MDYWEVGVRSWEWAGNFARREKHIPEYSMIKMWADEKAETLYQTEKNLTPQRVDTFLNSESAKEFMF